MKGPELRDLSDQIRQSRQANAVLLGSVDDGRVYFVVNLDRSLVDQGADAVAIVKRGGEADRRRRRRTSEPGGGRRQEPGRARRGVRDREERASLRNRLKVLALDYGSARTGVAVSDPTGTVARPVGVVERAGDEAGLTPDRRARPRARGRARRRRAAADDERRARRAGGRDGAVRQRGCARLSTCRWRASTSASRPTLAEQSEGRRRMPTDAVAAAHLLSSYLTWSSRASR